MRRITALLLTIFAAVAFAHSALAPDNPNDARRNAFIDAFNKGDVSALEKIFEPDAMLLTFGGQVVIGGKGIAKGMASMSPTLDLDLKPLRYREAGDLLYEAGTWSHFKKGTKEVKQLGTFVWVWKKEKTKDKDEWRLDTLSVTAAPGVPIEIKN